MLIASPGKPEGPLKVSDVTKSGCKLKWGKPEDDGGKPITGYVVEKLDKSTGRWIPVGRTSDTEMDVKGLQEGHEYEFRVKAVNEEGESEPLVTDSTTLAKNPYGKTILYTSYFTQCCRLIIFNHSFVISTFLYPNKMRASLTQTNQSIINILT